MLAMRLTRVSEQSSLLTCLPSDISYVWRADSALASNNCSTSTYEANDL